MKLSRQKGTTPNNNPSLKKKKGKCTYVQNYVGRRNITEFICLGSHIGCNLSRDLADVGERRVN